MAASKKVVKKVTVKKKKPVKSKFDLLDVLYQKILFVESQTRETIAQSKSDLTRLIQLRMAEHSCMVGDRLDEVTNNYFSCQTAVLDALAKRSDVDVEFLHKRVVVVEMLVKELSAKLLKLSPELS
jgi:hypothetical protein